MVPRVLIVSNLDSEQPFGQFTRPFFLGRGMARLGAEVANVAPDCSRVDFGPVWNTGEQSLAKLLKATKSAVAEFRPDVIYAHQNMPAFAAILARGGVPIVSDCHALASEEWKLRAQGQDLKEAAICRARQAKAFAAERVIVRRSSLMISAAPELEALVRARHGGDHSASVINGVDDRILSAGETVSPDPLRGPGPHIVSTLPIASSAANARALGFLASTVPAIREAVPGAIVHVLGTKDGEGPVVDGLVYHGMQDVLPWIDHADTCVMPYPAEAVVLGGVRNKLLEYLSRARTLVTTDEGLMGFSEAGEWEGVFRAPDSREGFAQAISAAVDTSAPTLLARREYVRETLGWDGHASAVLSALEGAAR